MKKITLLMSCMLIALASMAQTPIITMISDGDCSGGNPKVLEVYADGTVDFSLYSLENETNGNTGFGNSFNLSGLGTVTDDFVYIHADDPTFATEYPSATNTLSTTSSVMSFNGNDRVRIILDSNPTAAIDQYGASGVDGTGETWEYKDGYAKRNAGTTANGSFNPGDWTFNNGDLNGEGLCQGGSSFESIIGIGTFTPGTVACPLVITVTNVTCDTQTTGANSDTYTIVASFTGGGTETYVPTVVGGTIDVANSDDPSTSATGTIIVNATEGTDVVYTITSANCNIQGSITSPECEPSTNVVDIATLRQGTLGDKYTLTGEAFLTYQQTFRGQKYIQDATAAILIDDNDGNITTTYAVGDGITGITGELSEFNGVMQFIPESDPGAATSTGNNLTIQTVTIADFNANSEDYESELIAFLNVSLTDADGTVTFATGTNYVISNGSETTTMRTQFFDADYIGQVIPTTQLSNIVGIASQFDNGTDVTPQIFPRDSNDFNANLSASSNTLTNVSIYPNPSNTGLVTIETASNEAAAVEVYNLLGKQVISQTLTNSTLNVANLSSGVYLVKVSVEGKSATKKLVIE